MESVGVIIPKGGRLESPGEKESLGNQGQVRKASSVSIASSIVRGTTLLCFRMSDVAVSILVLLPLTIAFWRGVWQIMEYYSEDPWLSMGIGNAIPLTLYLLQEPLKQYVNARRMNFVAFYITTRCLLLVHSFGFVNQWRGLWGLMDQKTEPGFEAQSALLSLAVGFAVSIPLKIFCNVLAVPLVVGVDEASSIHDCSLRYKSPVSS